MPGKIDHDRITTSNDLQTYAEAKDQPRAHTPASDVPQHAVSTLNGDTGAADEWLRERVDEAFADPRPDVPARCVFERLRNHHRQNAKEAE